MPIGILQRTSQVAAPSTTAGGDVPSVGRALAWLAVGAVATFAASFLASDQAGLQHDLYLLIYATVVLAYLAWFVTRSRTPWRQILRSNLWWSLAVGALVGFAVVRQVMSQAGTGHPGGGYFAFELVWRGVVYGAIDALVLAVFPAFVAWLVLRGDRSGARRKLGFAGLTVLLSLVVSAAYHVGYPTYRGHDLSKPLIGSVMWDIPAAATGNPIGAVVAHAAVHTSAVVHQYYGGENHFLPPELTTDYPKRAGGALGQALAVAWVLVIGGTAVITRRRWQPVGQEFQQEQKGQ
jgi:hypothetical protein